MDIARIYDESLWQATLEASQKADRRATAITVGQGKIFTVFRYLESDLADYVVAVSKPTAVGLALPKFWVSAIQELGRSGWPLVPPMAAHIWKRDEGDVVVWIKPWLRHRVAFAFRWPTALAAQGSELECLLRGRGLVQTDAWDVRSVEPGTAPYVVDWSDLELVAAS